MPCDTPLDNVQSAECSDVCLVKLLLSVAHFIPVANMQTGRAQAPGYTT